MTDVSNGAPGAAPGLAGMEKWRIRKGFLQKVLSGPSLKEEDRVTSTNFCRSATSVNCDECAASGLKGHHSFNYSYTSPLNVGKIVGSHGKRLKIPDAIPYSASSPPAHFPLQSPKHTK